MNIKVEVSIHAPLDLVWETWTQPEDIKNWNTASDDWHTTHALNDLREGGNFSYRMEAKDGSFGFDFCGQYQTVIEQERIELLLDDGRKVRILFSEKDGATLVEEYFEPESENPYEMQQNGWQSILDHFRKYTEHKKNLS